VAWLEILWPAENRGPCGLPVAYGIHDFEKVGS